MKDTLNHNGMERIMQKRMPLNMWFPGYFCICIEGDHIQKTLSICSFRKIDLYDISYDENIVMTKISNEENKAADKTLTNKKKFYGKVSCQSYEELQSVCKKTNNALTILSVHGWIWLKEKLKKSASFCISLIICMCLILFLQTRIWDIQVEGNIYYDNPVILSFLKENDVTVGMKVKEVSCIELADQIREAFPKIKWASVELKGTNLIVHLKENMHIQINKEKQPKGGTKTENQSKDEMKAKNEMQDETALSDVIVNNNLIAPKNGIIHSIYVRSGIANVKIGDTCKKGDILVNGQIPIYNDAGEVVRYETVAADADVIIRYEQAYYDTIDREVGEYRLKDISKGYHLQVFDFCIRPYSIRKMISFENGVWNDWKKRKSADQTDAVNKKTTNKKTTNEKTTNEKITNENTTNEKITNEKKNNEKMMNEKTINGKTINETITETITETKQLKITSALTLPIYYGSNLTYEYEEISRKLTETETKAMLEKEISYFCEDLEKKGVQIYRNSVKIDVLNKKGIASGKMTLLELVR